MCEICELTQRSEVIVLFRRTWLGRVSSGKLTRTQSLSLSDSGDVSTSLPSHVEAWTSMTLLKNKSTIVYLQKIMMEIDDESFANL